MKRQFISAIAVALISASGAAQAGDGFYFGVGAGVSKVDSGTSSFGTESSSANLTLLSATAGVRKDQGGGFFGGELNGDFSVSGEFTDDVSGDTCAVDANGPYYCTHNATVRLRGIAGQTVAPGLELFGTLGLVVVTGTSATGNTVQEDVRSTGVTVGVGLQHSYSSGAVGRVELVFDKADNSNEPGGYQPQYKAFSLVASYLF